MSSTYCGRWLPDHHLGEPGIQIRIHGARSIDHSSAVRSGSSRGAEVRSEAHSNCGDFEAGLTLEPSLALSIPTIMIWACWTDRKVFSPVLKSRENALRSWLYMATLSMGGFEAVVACLHSSDKRRLALQVREFGCPAYESSASEDASNSVLGIMLDSLSKMSDAVSIVI